MKMKRLNKVYRARKAVALRKGEKRIKYNDHWDLAEHTIENGKISHTKIVCDSTEEREKVFHFLVGDGKAECTDTPGLYEISGDKRIEYIGIFCHNITIYYK